LFRAFFLSFFHNFIKGIDQFVSQVTGIKILTRCSTAYLLKI
jgi:hypothetical protein